MFGKGGGDPTNHLYRSPEHIRSSYFDIEEGEVSVVSGPRNQAKPKQNNALAHKRAANQFGVQMPAGIAAGPTLPPSAFMSRSAAAPCASHRMSTTTVPI